MAYMLMMVEPIGQRQSRTEAEGREAYARMVGWAESLQKRGLLIAAESLRSQASASRVRVLSGRKHVPAKDAYPKGYRGFKSLSFRIVRQL